MSERIIEIIIVICSFFLFIQQQHKFSTWKSELMLRLSHKFLPCIYFDSLISLISMTNTNFLRSFSHSLLDLWELQQIRNKMEKHLLKNFIANTKFIYSEILLSLGPELCVCCCAGRGMFAYRRSRKKKFALQNLFCCFCLFSTGGEARARVGVVHEKCQAFMGWSDMKLYDSCIT